MRALVLIGALSLLAGCGLFQPKPLEPEPSVPALPTRPQPPTPPAPTQPLPVPPSIVVEPPAPPAQEPTVAAQPEDAGKLIPVAMPWLKPVSWWQLPGWRDDDLTLAWPAWLQSCRGLRGNPAWTGVCQAAQQLSALPESDDIRAFLESQFQAWQVSQSEGGTEGLVTGYYEPLLRGSRARTARYRYPLYGPPDDMLVVDLGAIYPELKNLRLRGRLQGNKVVPYWNRAEIEAGAAPVRGKEVLWVDDPVEFFFLQVQGSGRVRLDNGETVRVGYADQNGHPYRSIGKWLVEKGEITLDKASMQGIKDWGRKNPDRLTELLNTNPSYVFFRELSSSQGSGPVGALGVPLTNERSIAVDPRGVPLGAPVWLATTRPNAREALNRLVLAQDTGSAIRGNVRADFFWGYGEDAGKLAGAMKQKGRMWVLLPRDYPIITNGKSGLQ
ncbi:MAG: murein transglycosylase A [Gallionellaceae bacterium]|nr:murein transglycosylase A [Gallionellaceae bacterium]